jgi:hypothetical protein
VAYNAALGDFHNWFVAGSQFATGPELPLPTTWTQAQREAYYSVGLWVQVKMWELNQMYGLEGIPQVPFGAKADSRGWLGSTAFDASPNMQHVAAGPGLGNGTATERDYLSLAWYQVQLILNDGQGQQSDHEPVDYGYVGGFIKNLFVIDAPNLPGISLQFEYLIKALQEFTQTGTSPESATGWHPIDTSPAVLVDFNWAPLWWGTSAATEASLTTAYTQAWFNQASVYSAAQYYQGGWAKATDNPAALFYSTTFGGQVWYMLPRLRSIGVPAPLTTQIAAWVATIWPNGNWALDESATCTSLLQCTSGY